MIGLHNMIYLWLLFIVFWDSASSQVNITLTSSLSAVKKACPSEIVSYNCSVIGSRILSWSSEEYIGTGGRRLEFSTSNPAGQRTNSQINPKISAVLRNVTDDGMNIFLKSELFIVVNQSSTISCSANTGSRQSSDLNVLLDSPEMPQDAAAVEIPSLLDRCVLLISWNHPTNIDSSDIDYYIVQTSHESEVPEIDDTTTLASFLSPCSELIDLHINVTAVDNCGREGVPTKNFAPQLVNYTQPPTNIVTVTVPTIIEYHRDTVTIAVTLAVVISAMIILAVAFLVIFMLRKRYRVTVNVSSDPELSQLIDEKIDEKLKKKSIYNT